ncbi:type VI secretion system baseplate subunit TssG [Marinobacter sp.]|uniref:type VI secretion system baseplate subunit TssG n=1 Tax=Marinobacter sp. TaxID=50741 RepID=UPI00384FF389
MSPVTGSKPGGSFFREVWRIERQIRGGRSLYQRVGHDGWPAQELVKFRTSQHLGFASQDIVENRTGRKPEGTLTAELSVDFLGLTGARGALPVSYTEQVLTQLKAKDPALRDFLDLFNHRLLSLFYRSWEKTQPAVAQERGEEDPFTRILRALTGSEADWEIYYGAALSRGARSASTLASVLADLTGMRVEVRSFQGGWESLAESDQSRLPSRQRPKGQYARLGEAMLGSRVWLADKGAEIVFHPDDRAGLAGLLPQGIFSEAVARISQRLASGACQLRYRVISAASDLPDVRLGQQGRLGADSFISARRSPDHRVEVSFKPSQGREKASCHQ